MSTNDVPGHNPANKDVLAMGSWAEHADGSLIFVKSTEDDRVIFEVYDMSKQPLRFFVDSMRIGAFKKKFSWDRTDPSSVKWTWHDKKPFPWDRVIKSGAQDGLHYTSADDQLSEAAKIAESRELLSKEVDVVEIESRIERLRGKAKKIVKKLQRAIEQLNP